MLRVGKGKLFEKTVSNITVDIILKLQFISLLGVECYSGTFQYNSIKVYIFNTYSVSTGCGFHDGKAVIVIHLNRALSFKT
jgi:hypothetical protein